MNKGGKKYKSKYEVSAKAVKQDKDKDPGDASTQDEDLDAKWKTSKEDDMILQKLLKSLFGIGQQKNADKEKGLWSAFPTELAEARGEEAEILRYHMLLMICVHACFMISSTILFPLGQYQVIELVFMWIAYQCFMYLEPTIILGYYMIMFFTGPLGVSRTFQCGIISFKGAMVLMQHFTYAYVGSYHTYAKLKPFQDVLKDMHENYNGQQESGSKLTKTQWKLEKKKQEKEELQRKEEEERKLQEDKDAGVPEPGTTNYHMQKLKVALDDVCEDIKEKFQTMTFIDYIVHPLYAMKEALVAGYETLSNVIN